MDVASLLKMRESRVRVSWENPVRGAHGPSTGSLGIQVGSCNDERTPSPKPPGPPNVAASLAGSKQLPKVGAGPKSGLLQAQHSQGPAEGTGAPWEKRVTVLPDTVSGAHPQPSAPGPCVSGRSGPL